METIDTSQELWKGKVIRYRKWEQRHDRTVDKMARRGFAKLLAELTIDLSNTARVIVQRTMKEQARWRTEHKPLRDETHTTVWGSERYTLKTGDEHPDRILFQRNEHEPWFDLGYWNDKEGCFQDVPVDPALVARNRAIDIARSAFMGRTDHIHIGSGMVRAIDMPFVPTELRKNIERNDPMNSDSPEALEAAAAHAMARAAELRALDAREPSGEEPTISWQHPGRYEDVMLTYVAFKAGNGRWYETAHERHESVRRGGKTWRELTAQPHAEALKSGTFHIVTEWSAIGGDE